MGELLLFFILVVVGFINYGDVLMYFGIQIVIIIIISMIIVMFVMGIIVEYILRRKEGLLK